MFIYLPFELVFFPATGSYSLCPSIFIFKLLGIPRYRVRCICMFVLHVFLLVGICMCMGKGISKNFYIQVLLVVSEQINNQKQIHISESIHIQTSN